MRGLPAAGASVTGAVRLISSSAEIASAPGRVDSPPMSRMAAPASLAASAMSSSSFSSSKLVSADGSRVYFAFVGRLIPELGNEGATNVYLADEVGLHYVSPDVRMRSSDDGRYAAAVAYPDAPADAREQRRQSGEGGEQRQQRGDHVHAEQREPEELVRLEA